MNDFTAKLFCSPMDAETYKSDLKLNLSFKFVVGNYTPWLPRSQTQWRRMPFSLCCYPIMSQGKLRMQTQGDEDRIISPRNAFFVPEGTAHNLSYLSGRKITSLWIHFRLTIFNSFSVFDFFEVPYTFEGTRAAAIRHYLDRLVQFPRVLDLAGSLELELTGMGLTRELLAEVKLKPERMAQVQR